MATVDLQKLGEMHADRATSCPSAFALQKNSACAGQRQVRLNISNVYIVLIICLGAAIFSLAARQLTTDQIDLRFACIAFFTISVSSRIVIPIPGFSSQISVSDTLIFLTLLLYGGSAAVLLAATEALFSSFRFSRKVSTILFNWSCAACSTSITAFAVYIYFGDAVLLNVEPFSPKVIATISLIALVVGLTSCLIVERKQHPIN